jgi:hypothetical protein
MVAGVAAGTVLVAAWLAILAARLRDRRRLANRIAARLAEVVGAPLPAPPEGGRTPHLPAAAAEHRPGVRETA